MYCVFHCCYGEGLPVPFPFGVCAVVPSSAPRFWRRPVCWDSPSSCPETRPGSADLSAAGAASGWRTRRQGHHFVSARSTLVFKSLTIAEANFFLPYRMYFNFITLTLTTFCLTFFSSRSFSRSISAVRDFSAPRFRMISCCRRRCSANRESTSWSDLDPLSFRLARRSTSGRLSSCIRQKTIHINDTQYP